VISHPGATGTRTTMEPERTAVDRTTGTLLAVAVLVALGAELLALFVPPGAKGASPLIVAGAAAGLTLTCARWRSYRATVRDLRRLHGLDPQPEELAAAPVTEGGGGTHSPALASPHSRHRAQVLTARPLRPDGRARLL